MSMHSELTRAVQSERALKRQIKALETEVLDKQFRIDSLMLQWCPSEMTPKQLVNWEKHQKLSPIPMNND